MASEQTNTNEAIVQAVVEATNAAILGMAVAEAERTQNVEPRPGRPVMKQPMFNWETEDKYNVLINFIQEVNNIFKLYSMEQAEQIAIIKQVECLVALCRAYVEVLLGGQSSSYVQTTLLVFLCCEATGG